MFEQIYQCSKYGLHKIILNLVEYCIKEKCSEESSKTLMNEFGGNDNVQSLAMAIIESAAISDGLKPFCSACYALEGDEPLILTAYLSIEKLEKVVNGTIEFSSLEASIPKCISMLKEASDPLRNQLCKLNDELKTAEGEFIRSKHSHIEKRSALEIFLRPTSSTGRSRLRTKISIDLNKKASLEEDLRTAQEEEERSGELFDSKKSEFLIAKKKMDDWIVQFPYQNRNDLLEYGKADYTLLRAIIATNFCFLMVHCLISGIELWLQSYLTHFICQN